MANVVVAKCCSVCLSVLQWLNVVASVLRVANVAILVESKCFNACYNQMFAMLLAAKCV